MSGCNQIQASFNDYLDGRLNGREMQQIAAHLDACAECGREWESLRRTQAALATLGPAPEPKDLLLKIRVAISRERARSRHSRLEGFSLAWKNTLGPFVLQASAGFASAVLLLGTVIVLVGMFTGPEAAQARTDEPLGGATAPRLLYLSSGDGSDNINTIPGQVVVEAYVNDAGEVYDYRIVSGPNDVATRSEVENLLVGSRFEPARFFGQPVRGLAVLSFAGVNVRG
jgi:anti-sigma factor RsiW